MEFAIVYVVNVNLIASPETENVFIAKILKLIC